VLAVDTAKNSPTKGMNVMIPVTIIETPPLKVFGVRFYEKTPYGLRVKKDIINVAKDKFISRYISSPSKSHDISSASVDSVFKIHLLVHTQPHVIKLKKTPEVFEIAIGGDVQAQFEKAKELLGKEIKVSDVFKPGDMVDVSAVTKGKGYQGSIKRFGVKLESKHTDKKRRRVGNLGPEGQAKVSWRVPQFGQMGFHTRTEYSKLVLMVDNKDITPKGGFINYGVLRSDWIMLKGSVPGPKKRLVRLRFSVRPAKQALPEIKYIYRESQQGN